MLGRPTREIKIKKERSACPVCRGRLYRIPAGAPCAGCKKNRNTNVCPGCGGMPERVEGAACVDCGTPAGKNAEYETPKRSYGSVKWDP